MPTTPEHGDSATTAAPRPSATAATSALAAGLHWVPIRSLAERHRPRILAHLLALPAHDRHVSVEPHFKRDRIDNLLS